MTELSRPLAPERVGAGGLEQVVEAGPEELAALAHRLKIPAVLRLRCTFRLRRESGSVIGAEGELDAEVVQVCVVELEEFAAPVRERFVVSFVPAGTETDDEDPGSPDQIPFDGVIDLGEAAAEQLALTLDPYPRRPDASVADLGSESATGPFAALASLKPRH